MDSDDKQNIFARGTARGTSTPSSSRRRITIKEKQRDADNIVAD